MHCRSRQQRRKRTTWLGAMTVLRDESDGDGDADSDSDVKYCDGGYCCCGCCYDDAVVGVDDDDDGGAVGGLWTRPEPPSTRTSLHWSTD